MKLAVRAFVVSLIFLASLLFLAKTPVFAQAQAPLQTTNSYAVPNTNPDVPNNLHTWTQNVLIEVMSAMTCQMIGVDPTNPSAKCLGIDQKTGKIGFVENGKGAIGLMGDMISITLNPPIHTSDYASYLTKNFGIVKTTYAANGIDSLKPLMELWKTFRDITYLLFILIFIIIGLAIMLRVKIDPRTVMTVQNQIPKIIVGLLLVTFSFAIAGFLIDIMWILIYLFINLITKADPKINALPAITNLNNTTIGFVNNTFNGGVLGIAKDGALSFGQIIINVFTGGSAVSNNSIVDIITNTTGALLGLLIGGIAGSLAFFIIVIALLWSMFKLWFALLEAYVMIMIDIVFAPFWIITGLLPGNQSLGFGAWLRDILGNLAAFPTAVGMFMLGQFLIDAFGSNNNPGQFNPPLIGSPAATGTNIFGAIIALGIIFTTPNVVKITKQAFKAPKIDLGPIGQAAGVGQSVVGGTIGGATNNLFKRDQEGKAFGPGATFIDSKINNRFIRGALGWRKKEVPKVIVDRANAAGSTGAPKENTKATSDVPKTEAG